MNQNQEKISWDQMLTRIPQGTGVLNISGLGDASAGYAIAGMLPRLKRPVVLVTSTDKAAARLGEELSLFLNGHGRDRLEFPSYNVTAFKPMAFHNETAARRIRTLYKMVEDSMAPVVVTTVTALSQKLLPKSELVDYAELLMAGEEIDRDAMVRKLVAGGYTRTMIVEEHGDFCLRGGILDVHSPLYPDPLRIEFFGDMVESIRLFAAETQRTIDQLDDAVILPARESILHRATLNAVVGRIRALATETGMPVTQVRQITQQIKAEGIYAGLESLIPLIYDGLDTFFDYVSADTLFVLLDPTQLAKAAGDFEARAQESYQSAQSRKHLCLPPSQHYMGWPEIVERMSAFSQLAFKTLALVSPDGSETDRQATYETRVQDNHGLRRALELALPSEHPFQPLVDWVKAEKQARHTAFLVCRRPSNLDRLAHILSTYGVPPVRLEDFGRAVFGQGRIYLISGILTSGFSWADGRVSMVTDEEIFGTQYRNRKAPARPKATELLNFEDLKQDDWVVHPEHGIGQYDGLTKLRVEGVVNDFLLIRYLNNDKLYLPVERMHQVQKYMGVEGVAPVMDKMGGKSWDRVKNKVKRKAEKIAGELLKLYAARKVQQGHAFGEADAHFYDFEEGFPYEETADQHKAINDVLEDMRLKIPMDRLVCGDVGYGKTEVALRAAFLAVSEAKQVALLVPTTVLAEQHYETFRRRFANYPVKTACLSRFRPLREQREIVAGIKSGQIDIVIGTHRLLQKDVAFNELGLLILDEEQRFGVRHKERIKRFRKTVDVLTLTATPIPRTLHLSLLGIRDISIINTPPEQRRPIVTYVTEFDDAIVAEAIRKELGRHGQIFFVHNNIRSIHRMAQHLQKLVPEVRLAVGHGRMAEKDLEKVMLDFMQQRLDMLVCTTIIESGLDVATANTILINRADRFGLSQIYQLRGRVGRSDEQAYAYMFIPSESTLTKDAQKRLKVLMEYSDLGSGFQIAMSDLKIRGGGTILGASQSGHIAAVGYDMFLKLMETSIAELKGEPVQEPLEPEINLPFSAFLPETYIPDIDQRLSLYRRLAKMTDLKAIGNLKTEMTDRFGRLPDEANNLLLKIMLKVLCVRAGCKRLDLIEQSLRLQFSEVHQRRPFGIVEMVGQGGHGYRFTPDHTFKAALSAGTPNALLAQTKNILIEIARHVNH
ncbi:MAG: transcription-repair coupling factor [Desulfobacteraceae bacterium]|jgi:transcription-repair coupling factor (superfamily II helicase)